MVRHENRPIRTCEELIPHGLVLSDKSLVLCEEFLKLARLISGVSVTRRTLQLYSSPEFSLVPLPVYARRHTSHYRHPEDTMRLAVVLYLRDTYFFPVAVLRSVLQTIDPRFYPIILSGLLTPTEIKHLAAAGPGKESWIALLRKRTAKLLNDLNVAQEGGINSQFELGAAVKTAAELRSRLLENRMAFQAELAVAGNGN